MPAEEEAQATGRRNVLVGLRFDNHGRELLNWALVKVAEPGDCVIAVHVCRSSRGALKDKPLLDSYLEVYDGLCSLKKVDLIGQVCAGISVQRTLVRKAKIHDAVALVVGISNQSALGGWTSTAGYCTKRLPPTTDVLAIHNGKILFGRCTSYQLSGLSGDPRPSLNLLKSPLPDDVQSEFGGSELDTVNSIEVLTRCESQNSKDEIPTLPHELQKRSTAYFTGDILDQRPGWPLLRRATSASLKTLHARELSVVQWAMSLPVRWPHKSPLGSSTERSSERESSDSLEESNGIGAYGSGELHYSLEILLKTNFSGCKWFNYEVLKIATSKFSPGNLIGKGECNRVYKGILPDGKQVAVKIRKSSPEARKDFAQEVEIISSLNHKNIVSLVGVCIRDTDLISVYDLFTHGNLEENLQGDSKYKSAVSWEMKSKIAIKIAEALTYLHSECSPPVIHRDVKSSNILLSDELEPQLSDFGLAVWGPTTSSCMTQCDVVGTFGYLAPEYFMYGKVSDKIDVYAFGVILLELLSGRRPIGHETSKNQESLVMWAKPKVDCGNARDILDPNLDKYFDEDQLQRMILAAKLCITRSARLRPKMIEVLNLLRGDKDAVTWANLRNKDLEDNENQEENDDEVYPNSSAELHLNLALLDLDDDSISSSSLEQGNNLCVEEYLKGRWNQSSRLN